MASSYNEERLTKLAALKALAKKIKGEQDKHTGAKATGSAAGHVTLSDATDSGSGAAAGVAATPAAVKAVKDYAASLLGANDAMVFKGTLGSGGTTAALPQNGYKTGWTYRVITAGTYAGSECEVGDLVICVKDYATAAADTDWTVVQTNIDGAVTGPASATAAHVAVFDGATGRVIKDGGFTIASNVPSGAKFTDTVYTHPASASGGSKTSGLYKITTDANGHVSAVAAVEKTDITGLGIPAQDTTYNDATTTVHGLMSVDDKKKLDSVTIATDEEITAMLEEVFATA